MPGTRPHTHVAFVLGAGRKAMPLSPEEGVFQLHLERRARLRLNSEEGACTAARDRQPAPPGSWLQALCTPQAQSKALVCSAACCGHVPHAGGLNSRRRAPQRGGGRGPRSRCQRVRFCGGLSPVDRQLLSRCDLTWLASPPPLMGPPVGSD